VSVKSEIFALACANLAVLDEGCGREPPRYKAAAEGERLGVMSRISQAKGPWPEGVLESSVVQRPAPTG